MAEKKIIQVETRMGKREISLDSVIRFPHGLIGLKDKRDFVLLRIKDDVPFMVLQSLEDPTLGLMVADPYTFMEDFSITLSDAELFMLNAERASQISILVTVNIPAGKPEDTCLCLTGPLVMNHEARIGLQIARSDANGPDKFYIKP